MNTKSQMSRVFKQLTKNATKYPGITVSRLADRAGVPHDSVYKRIHDLRNEGLTIYSNFRNVNGERKMYYRLAS